MKRFSKLTLAAALLGLLAFSASAALAADVTIRPAVYTTGGSAPTLATQTDNSPTITTVGWRRYGYRPYYGYRAPVVVARPYAYGAYYGAYPYTGYYGVTPRVYPPYVAPGYYGYRRGW